MIDLREVLKGRLISEDKSLENVLNESIRKDVLFKGEGDECIEGESESESESLSLDNKGLMKVLNENVKRVEKEEVLGRIIRDYKVKLDDGEMLKDNLRKEMKMLKEKEVHGVWDKVLKDEYEVSRELMSKRSTESYLKLIENTLENNKYKVKRDYNRKIYYNKLYRESKISKNRRKRLTKRLKFLEVKDKDLRRYNRMLGYEYLNRKLKDKGGLLKSEERLKYGLYRRLSYWYRRIESDSYFRKIRIYNKLIRKSDIEKYISMNREIGYNRLNKELSLNIIASNMGKSFKRGKKESKLLYSLEEVLKAYKRIHRIEIKGRLNVRRAMRAKKMGRGYEKKSHMSVLERLYGLNESVTRKGCTSTKIFMKRDVEMKGTFEYRCHKMKYDLLKCSKGGSEIMEYLDNVESRNNG